MRTAILFLLLLATADETRTAKSAALRFDENAGPLKKYGSPAAEFDFIVKERPAASKYKSFDVTFPSALKTELEANGTVPGKVWVPVGDAPAPGLVLVHFIGANHDILASVGSALARGGIASILFELPYYGPRGGETGRRGMADAAGVKELVDFFRQSIFDVRRARDVLAAMPGVDPQKIGLLGVSLGSLIGAAAAGIDPTFSPVVLIVGGGDLAKICFTESRETDFLRDRFKKQDIDEAKAREAFTEVEPLTFAARIPAERCLMFNMEGDEVIPKECTDALAQKIGKPIQFWYKGKHTWIALHTFAIVDEVKKFIFKK